MALPCRVEVLCQQVQRGQLLAVSGSSDPLGAWDYRAATRLHRESQEGLLWLGNVPCPRAGTEFKFVVLTDCGALVGWEPIRGGRSWPAGASVEGAKLCATFGKAGVRVVSPAPVDGGLFATLLSGQFFGFCCTNKEAEQDEIDLSIEPNGAVDPDFDPTQRFTTAGERPAPCTPVVPLNPPAGWQGAAGRRSAGRASPSPPPSRSGWGDSERHSRASGPEPQGGPPEHRDTQAKPAGPSPQQLPGRLPLQARSAPGPAPGASAERRPPSPPPEQASGGSGSGGSPQKFKWEAESSIDSVPLHSLRHPPFERKAHSPERFRTLSNKSLDAAAEAESPGFVHELLPREGTPLRLGLMKATLAAISAPPSPAAPAAPAALGDRPWRLLPSVGTWYAPLRPAGRQGGAEAAQPGKALACAAAAPAAAAGLAARGADQWFQRPSVGTWLLHRKAAAVAIADDSAGFKPAAPAEKLTGPRGGSLREAILKAPPSKRMT